MKTTLRLSETLAVKAEAAVVLAAVPFLNKRLRCHQVHIAWDLNSVPLSLSILRHIPYMVLSAPHSQECGSSWKPPAQGDSWAFTEDRIYAAAPPGWVKVSSSQGSTTSALRADQQMWEGLWFTQLQLITSPQASDHGSGTT